MSQWELLVTEGHVRAERWRNAVPVLFAMAVAAVVIGFSIMALLPRSAPSGRVMQAQQAHADTLRASIMLFLQDKGVVAAPAGAENALTRETAPATVAGLLGVLAANNRLQESAHVVNAEEFWRGNWQPGVIEAVEKNDTILIGYFIDLAYRYPGYQSQPMIQRSFGLYRRGAEGWTYHCLSVPGAYPCERDALDPSAIPQTMREFIPPEALRASRS